MRQIFQKPLAFFFLPRRIRHAGPIAFGRAKGEVRGAHWVFMLLRLLLIVCFFALNIVLVARGMARLPFFIMGSQAEAAEWGFASHEGALAEEHRAADGFGQAATLATKAAAGAGGFESVHTDNDFMASAALNAPDYGLEKKEDILPFARQKPIDARQTPLATVTKADANTPPVGNHRAYRLYDRAEGTLSNGMQNSVYRPGAAPWLDAFYGRTHSGDGQTRTPFPKLAEGALSALPPPPYYERPADNLHTTPSWPAPESQEPTSAQPHRERTRGLPAARSRMAVATRSAPEPVNPHQQFNPKFLRQEVALDPREFGILLKPGEIVIDTEDKFLFLTLSGGRALRYGIGVGRPGFLWAGTKFVSRKAQWPDWTPPKEMLERRPDLPRHMDGGLDNPLGARALYLGSSLYRIHGTNDPATIGHNVSSGCIRLANEDVIDLYNRVKIGTKVVVLP